MPSTSKKSTSAHEKRAEHKKKQSSKRSMNSSMVVNTSATSSTVAAKDAQGYTVDEGHGYGDEDSSHDAQYYLQGIGSQFDGQDNGGR